MGKVGQFWWQTVIVLALDHPGQDAHVREGRRADLHRLHGGRAPGGGRDGRTGQLSPEELTGGGRPGNRPAAAQVNLAEHPRFAAQRKEMEALLLAEQERLDDPFRLVDISAGALTSDPARLADEAAAQDGDGA